MEIINDESFFEKKLPIFATKNYLQSRGQNFGWFYKDGLTLPFVLDKKAVFTRLIITYETISVKNKEIPPQKEKIFLNNVIQKSKKENLADFIANPQANVVFNTCPENSKCVPWGSFIVDITPSEEQILKNFKSHHRRKVRQALREDAYVTKTDDIDLIYNNLKATMTRQKLGLYPSKDYLRNVKKYLSDNVRFYTTLDKNDELQASAVVFYNKFGGYYLYGGSIHRPLRGSTQLLHYEIMKDLRKEGVPQYDFVGARLNVEKGSKYYGIQHFKERFGAELKKGYTFKYAIKPFKEKLFHTTAKTYLFLKGLKYTGDPIDQISEE